MVEGHCRSLPPKLTQTPPIMSEIRTFETVEIESPRLPTIGLNEVLACRDAHRINAPVSSPLQGRRAVLSAMATATCFEVAYTALVKSSLRLNPEQVVLLRPGFEKSIHNRDRMALITTTQQLIQAEERREVTAALQILGEAARSLHFKVNALRPECGLIEVATGRGQETITVEARHGKGGQLRVASDSNGFHAGHCVEATSRWFEAAGRLGLKTLPGQSQRKRPCGVRTGNARSTQSLGG